MRNTDEYCTADAVSDTTQMIIVLKLITKKNSIDNNYIKSRSPQKRKMPSLRIRTAFNDCLPYENFE